MIIGLDAPKIGEIYFIEKWAAKKKEADRFGQPLKNLLNSGYQ